MELQIIRAQEFIRLGARGRIDFKASQVVLKELAAACAKRGINRALLDLRMVRPGPTPLFSPADLIKLVNSFREIGFTRGQHLAILYESDPHHRAPMFVSIARTRGWKVQAFDCFEEAFLWLTRVPEPPNEMEKPTPTEATPIPVRKRSDLPAADAAEMATRPVIRIKASTQTSK